MELSQLRQFVQVAQAGSFSRAAVALGTSQPFLSRQVGLLEAELHRHLFYRHGRGVTLTDAGAQFLQVAVSVLRQLDVAAEPLSTDDEQMSGTITVGLPPSVGRMLTVHLVQRFAARFSKARIAIVEGLSSVLHDALLTDRVDIAFLYDRPSSALLQSEVLAVQPLHLISRRTGGADDDAAMPLDGLRGVPLILPSLPHPIRAMLEMAASRQGVPLCVAYEVDGVEPLLQLAEAGVASTIATAAAVRTGRYAASLGARRLVDPEITSVLSLAVAARRPSTGLLLSALELTRETSTEILAP